MASLTLCSVVHVAHAMEEDHNEPHYPRDATRLIEEKLIQLTHRGYSPPSIKSVTEAVNNKEKTVKVNENIFELNSGKNVIKGNLFLKSFHSSFNKMEFSYVDDFNSASPSGYFVVHSQREPGLNELKDLVVRGYTNKKFVANGTTLSYLQFEAKCPEDVKIFVAKSDEDFETSFQKFQLIKWLAEDAPDSQP